MDSGSKLHAVPWMIRVLGSRLWMVAALAGLEMVIAGGGVYTAWVMRDLVNAAVGGASDALRLSVVVFAAVSAALIALRALYRFLQERARTMFQNILRLRFLGKVLHAELSSVQAVHTGEWMSRLTDDARIVASGVTTVVPSAAGMLAQLVGSLALLAIMVPQIAWMLIPAGIVFTGFTLGFRRVLKRLHKRIRETDGCARSHLIECLNSLLVVKSFQREDFAERGAAALLEDHRAACMRRNRFSNLCNVGFGLAMRGAYLMATAYCAYGILEGSVSYDSLRLELIGLNLVVSSLNTTRRLIRFENILALKRLHVGKGIEPIDLLGMVSIQLFFPKVFEWVKRNALYLCDERRSNLPPESVAV